MTEESNGITRRDFLRGVGYAALAAAIGGKLEALPLTREAKVVLVRDANVLDGERRINSQVLAQMLDQGVSKLMEEKDPAQCWKRLVKPDELVGIKTNHGHTIQTPREVEQEITRRIIAAGVPQGNIRMADGGARETLGDCTALINVRPARSHHWSGIGGCIKNYIRFAENLPAYHPDSCADLGAIWNLPMVKGKTRLNILLALTPLFWGRGPHHYDPRYVWDYKGLFVSFDPVAVDALGAQLLQTKRIAYFGEDQPITPTKHIMVADVKHNLGVSDLKQIKLIKLGWTQDALI